MPKILTLSVVALFVAAVSLFAFAGPGARFDTASADTAAAAPPDAGPPDLVPAAIAKPLATGAPVEPTPPATYPGTFTELVQAFRAGDWRLVAAFALAGLMVLLRGARDRVAWFRGDRGGAILVALLALAGVLSMSLATSAPINAQMFLSALAITWTAVGGYTWVKRLIWPSDPTPAAAAPPVPLPKAQVA